MDPKLLRESLDRIYQVVEDEDAMSEEEMHKRMEEIKDGVDELQDIQESLFELRERLADAIRSYSPDNYQYWKSYGLAQLAIIAGSEEYLSREENINSIIDDLKEEYAELRDEVQSGEDIG